MRQMFSFDVDVSMPVLHHFPYIFSRNIINSAIIQL